MGKVGVSSGMLGAMEGARRRDSLHEERLEVFSAHEGGNLSPRATGGDASGSELAIIPFGVGLESPLAETLALQVEKGEGRGRMEFQLPREVQSLSGNADSWV